MTTITPNTPLFVVSDEGLHSTTLAGLALSIKGGTDIQKEDVVVFTEYHSAKYESDRRQLALALGKQLLRVSSIERLQTIAMMIDKVSPMSGAV